MVSLNSIQILENELAFKLHFDIMKLSPLDILLSSNDQHLYSSLINMNCTFIENGYMISYIYETYFDSISNEVIISNDMIGTNLMSILSNNMLMNMIKSNYLKLLYRRLVLNLTKLYIDGKYYIRKWISDPKIRVYSTSSIDNNPNSIIIEIQEVEYSLVECTSSRNLY